MTTRFDCVVCSALQVPSTITTKWDQPSEPTPSEWAQLEGVVDDLHRCTRCETYYLLEHTSDHDHWMANDSYVTLSRLSPTEARARLAKARKPDALRALEAALPAQIAALEAAPPSEEVGEHLAAYHEAYGDLPKLVALLEHEHAGMRAGAAKPLVAIAREQPLDELLVLALVPLLDDDRTSGSAINVLHPASWHPTLEPALPLLVARFDHANEWTRGYAALLVSGFVKRNQVSVTPALRALVPALQKHVKKPLKVITGFGGAPETTRGGAQPLLNVIIDK